MKTLFTLLILLIGLNLNAQLFGTLNIGSFNFGMVYNKPLTNIGLYVKVTQGRITQETDLSYFKIENTKIGLGISLPLKNKDQNTFYLGINKNFYYNQVNTSFYYSNLHTTFTPIKNVSIDLGVSMKIERFSLLIMTDLLTMQTCLGVSYQLKRQK